MHRGVAAALGSAVMRRNTCTVLPSWRRKTVSDCSNGVSDCASVSQYSASSGPVVQSVTKVPQISCAGARCRAVAA